MNGAERSRWLDPSPPIAVDGIAPAHETRVRDLRLRFGDPETYVAECSCGWVSQQHTGRLADRAARREGLAHVDSYLPPHGHRGRSPRR